jgi:hypothetical protein
MNTHANIAPIDQSGWDWLPGSAAFMAIADHLAALRRCDRRQSPGDWDFKSPLAPPGRLFGVRGE